MDIKYKVSVWCITYNQAKYITDTMNGFCMQQTDFPFVCTIIDDASTDGEQKVIETYMAENFDLSESGCSYRKETDYAHIIYAQHKENKNCYFAVLFLKENHYQKGIGWKKKEYIKKWTDGVPYRALCEGDDYWTAPNKLQKQVCFMELNPDFSMCCSEGYLLAPDGCVDASNRYKKDTIASVDDIISKGGGFILTCSILHRTEIMHDFPSCCTSCKVGDYPLQIWCSLNGKVMYFEEKMVTYRTFADGSWTSSLQGKPLESHFPIWDSIITMLKGLDAFSNGKYHRTFKRTYLSLIHNTIFIFRNERKKIEMYYPDVVAEFKTMYVVEDFFLKHGMYKMASGCFSLWLGQYKGALATFPLTSSICNIYFKLKRRVSGI